MSVYRQPISTEKLPPAILNFSHPLTDLQRNALRERFGEFVEIRVPAQFNLNSDSLRTQVEDMVNEAIDQVGLHPIAAVIPPALSAAAYWVGVTLSLSDAGHIISVPAVWLRRESDFIPPKYIVGGVE